VREARKANPGRKKTRRGNKTGCLERVK